MHCTNKTNHKFQDQKGVRLLVEAKAGKDKEFQILFNQYWPLVRRLWQEYYVADLELDDWQQEAEVVLMKVLEKYRGTSALKFAGFYKQSLINRLLDLYRARQAGKRIPAGQLSSLGDEDANLLVDGHCNRPEDVVYCQKCLADFMHRCSTFERQVIVLLHQGASIKELESELDCDERKIRSALTRSRRKLIAELRQKY
ncbi:MAG: RNA polymerase sigma factor [Limosilactobacillus sp.]